MYQVISGGVTAAQGFCAGATRCGIKESSQNADTAIIVSKVPCTAAAVYTQNRVQASPIHVTRAHLKNQKAQAVIVNSGNANACAPDGMENAMREAQACAKFLNLPVEDIIVCSTGVIGQRLPITRIEENLHTLTLSADGSDAAANAIMTTDTVSKSFAVSFTIDGKTCHLGGICKGSGMIHPNMGTMLCFLTTDCAVDGTLLQTLLRRAVQKSFNRVSVDGDTSTNDTCAILANGLAGNMPITQADPAASEVFYTALEAVCIALARKIAADGEGASRLITCTVTGAPDENTAEGLAKAVCKSSLVKAAMFGADANWGRILCAMGYSGEAFDPDTVDVAFSSDAGMVAVCQSGRALDFDETLAKKILLAKEITICITLHAGDDTATAWGCDLTYDYVKINGDYRT